MGTFSKALASIRGFIAADDEAVLEYLRHNSKPLIFSAALPASNTASVLACLDILNEDPDRVTRLWDITRRVHAGYREIGLITKNSKSPIIPIYIGAEEKAKNALVAASVDSVKGRGVPKWLELDSEGMKGKVLSLPARDDVNFPIQEQLIVELYSK